MNVKRELGIRALVAAGVVTLAFLAFSDFVATRSNIGWVMSLMAYAISACVIWRIIGPTAGQFKPQWRIGAWVAAAALILFRFLFFEIGSVERAFLTLVGITIAASLIWQLIRRK
jgi:hypothetical protein